MSKPFAKLAILMLIVMLGAGCVSDRNETQPSLYHKTIQTRTGSLTIDSPMPIVSVESQNGTDFKFMQFAPLTWYVAESKEGQKPFCLIMTVVDKPSVVGELPDYSQLNNITVTDSKGNVSRANDFKAWKSRDGKIFLNVRSEGFSLIEFWKKDRMDWSYYYLNGTSIPLDESVYYEDSVVILVRPI